MATITAATLIDAVAQDLNDVAHDRWSRAELLAYLNDGQLSLCAIKPDVHTETVTIRLSPGSKQAVPANCHQLQKILRNMGTTGQAPGRAITQVSMQQLDTVSPNWHAAPPSDEVTHWIFEEKNPKVFWVYPRNTGAGYVEAILCTAPAAITAESSTISLDDIYKMPLYHYMMHRAYTKDADVAASAALSQIHYQAFINALITREQREKAEAPVPGGQNA